MKPRRMLYERPELLHHLLDVNARAVTAYLNAQIEAGAQAVMLFDTWGGALSGEAFHEFSLRYMQKHCSRACGASRTGTRIPAHRLHQGRRVSGSKALRRSAPTRWDSTGPWTSAKARTRVGDRVALQGNLDPAVLFAKPEVDPARGRQGAGRLRTRQRPCFQPGPRDIAVHAARKRRSAGGSGAVCKPPIPLGQCALKPSVYAQFGDANRLKRRHSKAFREGCS